MSKFGNFGLISHLLVILLNPWWWIIAQRNFLISLLIFILSLVTFQYFYIIRSRNFLLLAGLTAILGIICVKSGFDNTIFINSALDTQQYNKRHEFYAADLGKLYTNRFSLMYFKDYSPSIFKLEQNVFSNLDPNLYFFKSHPRERLGIDEFEKYFPIFLPFFLIGSAYYICKAHLRILGYLLPILLISAFISPKFYLGPILFFPIMNLMITVGLILSFNLLSGYYEKVFMK